MIKKPDLRIDTQFFDDNLNGIHIPQAIRVTQSIDTQTFIKQGLSDDALEGSTVLALETIEKVISQRLFDNFLTCWSKLKANTIPHFSSQSTPYSRKGHRRQSPLVQNEPDEYETASNTQFRGIELQKARFTNIRTRLQGDQLQWLHQHRRNINKKTVLRGQSQGKFASGESHYERAKVLKQIVDKLRLGRQVATSIIQQLQTNRESQQLHHKLNKLERLMEEVRSSPSLKETKVQHHFNGSNSHHSHRQPHSNQTELVFRLTNDLSEVRAQMEKIRRTNQQILRQSQWKKEEMMRVTSQNWTIQSQFESLRNQISYLQHQKNANRQRFEQFSSVNHANRQQFDRQIPFSSHRMGHADERQRVARSTQRSIVPQQTNPFGYSTFTTTQKNSNAVNNTWQQSTKPVASAVIPLQISEEARQRADEWACC